MVNITDMAENYSTSDIPPTAAEMTIYVKILP